MVRFLLNLPYTVIGLIFAFLSIPYRIAFKSDPYALIVSVKSFWWAFGYMKKVRAMAMGHVVILGNKLKEGDLRHELIHIEQCQRIPVIFPILYCIELIRKGYQKNKYEIEAYQKAGNIYINE